MTRTILVIDDELSIGESIRQILKDAYRVLYAPSITDAYFRLSETDVDVVMLDIVFPVGNGINALKEIKYQYPLIEVIMITSYGSVDTVQKALRYGAIDFLCKPFDIYEVRESVEKALDRREKVVTYKREHEMQSDQLSRTLADLRNAKREIFRALEINFMSMLISVQSSDHYTWEHCKHVNKTSIKIATALHIDHTWIECSSVIHDVGKFMVPREILQKKIFTENDKKLMAGHVQYGAKLINEIPSLEQVADIVLHHHENFDGSGYPDGLRGQQIPLESRVIRIADAIDSMKYAPWKRGEVDVGKELINYSGQYFDPLLVDVVEYPA